ncbi:MAG: FAD-dependent oxidoreductase [Desulfobacteraceae bacterium]|nr:FAD-dependent oxidoreductase [Desulfobacteraceae bacterium]
MKTGLKDAHIPGKGRLENSVSLFIPKSNASSRLNKTGSWRFVRPVFLNRTAPCSAFCPAGNDIPKIEFQVASGDIAGAFTTLMQETPFPSTCGRVCFHSCEGACNRAFQDSPVAIRSLERFVGDTALEMGLESGLKPLPSNGRKVAILGAGPAGLSAAYFLSLVGFACEIFEKTAEPGGVLRWGIPSYRLPKEILGQEINRILAMGVTLHTSHPLSPTFIKEARGNYDAIFISPGLSQPRPVGIKGEERIRDGIQFLKEVQTGSPMVPEGKIAVIGGGNTAIDVARSLLRLGGSPVIIYRRRRQDMPAFAHEIDAAENEGIEIMELTAPIAVEQEGDAFRLTLRKMISLEPEKGERADVKPDTAKPRAHTFSAVYSGIGAGVHEEWAPRKNARKLKLSHLTLNCREPLLMFGGDPVNKKQSVADAIASGKQAAMALHTYVEAGREPVKDTIRTCCTGDRNNLSMEIYLLGPRSERSHQVVSPEEINRDYFETSLRRIPDTAPLDSAMASFDEIEKTFAQDNARAEAARCYQCGYCNISPLGQVNAEFSRIKSRADSASPPGEQASRDSHISMHLS